LVATVLTAAPADSAGDGKGTVTTVTAATPAITGQPITFTATVTHGNHGRGAPTGDVTFSIRGSDGSTPQCSGGTDTIGLASGGDGSQAQCSIAAGASASASRYQITAAYGGDGTYAPSAGSLSKTIHDRKGATPTTVTPPSNPASQGPTSQSPTSQSPASPGMVVGKVKNPATITLSSSVPGPDLETGQPVTFTATVTAAPGPATGSIVFSVVGPQGQVATCDGGATQPLTTSGGVTTATCSLAKGLLGQPLYYTVSAKLVDPHFKAPTATLVQQIQKSLTRTTVKQLPGSVTASEAFTFKAVVQDITPGTGSPTGFMEFAICPYYASACTGGPGGVFLMGAPTKWDKAHNENRFKFSLPSGVLTPGFYAVSADYVGDSNYWSSQSTFSFLLVTPVPTSVTVVASSNPTFSGGREVLRAVVKAGSRATASLGGPTGTVTYTITGASGHVLVCQENGTDMIPVGTKPANQGVARCTISGDVQSADSPYAIKAVYSGDSVYDGSSGRRSLDVINQP
jgi:hypothetical protein